MPRKKITKVAPAAPAPNAEPPKPRAEMTELGATGLERYSGMVNEEWLQQLKGTQGRRNLREMSETDAVVRAILFAIEMLLRPTEWSVEAGGETPADEEAREYLESITDDMSHTMSDMISEWMATPVYGFSPFEIVLKLRQGEQPTPGESSKFNDGRIGVRKLAIRHPTTVDRWVFDDAGGVQGVVQRAAPKWAPVTIPIEKLLLFRTLMRKGNPEGESLLKGAFISWVRKKKLETIEAIGIERNMAGFPLGYHPPEWGVDGSPQSSMLTEFRKVVTRMKADEQAGLALPAIFDENGNRLLSVELISTSGKTSSDVSPVIQRYTQHIAMSVLADVILLGHEKVGSYALAQPLSAKILTPSGWTTMGKIGVGDRIVCPLGHPSVVLDMFEHGVRPVYRITLADGREVMADAQHKWVVTNVGWKMNAVPHRARLPWAASAPDEYPMLESHGVLTTEQISQRMRDGRSGLRFHVPRCQPVEYAPQTTIPMDPYILGTLLGDGNIPPSREQGVGGPVLTTGDDEIAAEVSDRLPRGHRLVPRKSKSRAKIFRLSGPGGRGTNEITSALDVLGLIGTKSHTKHIPTVCLTASVSDRVWLLRGLMDTDGQVSEAGQVRFSSVSTGLRDGVVDLVRGLGGTASVSSRISTGYTHPITRERVAKTTVSWLVTIQMPDGLNPFHLTRKAERVRLFEYTRPKATGIVSIELAGEEEVRCIAVSSPSAMYVTDGYTPTHNSSSKTNLFAAGLGALLDDIQGVLNRHLVPRLMRINGFKVEKYPQFRHSDLETVELAEVGAYIQQLAGAGFPLFPSENNELENELMRFANLPVPEHYPEKQAPPDPFAGAEDDVVEADDEGDVEGTMKIKYDQQGRPALLVPATKRSA